MKREVIRVEPLSSYLAKWNAPISPVTRTGNMVFVSGFPPLDPASVRYRDGLRGGDGVARLPRVSRNQPGWRLPLRLTPR